MLTKIDANDKPWYYTYDDAGRLLSVTDPLTQMTSFVYDAVGNKVTEIDARDVETRFEYDSQYNLIKTTRVMDAETPENNPVTLFEYNLDGKLIQETDPEGNQIHYEYDAEERLIRTTDGNGNDIILEYDDADAASCTSCSGDGQSQPDRIIYPTFEKAFTYDQRGRKIKEVDSLDADTREILYAYDDVGNLILKTDAENKSTAYDYDNLNRLVKVTDASSGITTYAYDNRDNLIRLTDAEGNTTRFEYDLNNRLVKEIRPLLQETNYSYDGIGNLIEKIDAKNQKTAYKYDDAGKLTEIRYFAAGDHVTPVKTVNFTYDEMGNLLGYDDGTTSASYVYDDQYRKLSETVNYGGFSKTNAVSYHKNGLKQTFTGPDAIAYGYLYDDANQLTGVQVPNLGFITINEYTWNCPKSMTLPGGGTREFVYDPLMRVKQIIAKDPGENILLNYQYNYDKMDNITDKVTEDGDYGYGYDELYRLTAMSMKV